MVLWLRLPPYTALGMGCWDLRSCKHGLKKKKKEGGIFTTYLRTGMCYAWEDSSLFRTLDFSPSVGLLGCCHSNCQLSDVLSRKYITMNIIRRVYWRLSTILDLVGSNRFWRALLFWWLPVR